MNKRLTYIQKMFTVYLTMMNAEHPMSRAGIAKSIGFKSGIPLTDAINELKSRQMLIVYEEQVCGKTVEYYWADETDLAEMKDFVDMLVEES